MIVCKRDFMESISFKQLPNGNWIGVGDFWCNVVVTGVEVNELEPVQLWALIAQRQKREVLRCSE